MIYRLFIYQIFYHRMLVIYLLIDFQMLKNYVGIHANTRAYAESFLPSTLHEWNNLPEAAQSADTLAAIKSK